MTVVVKLGGRALEKESRMREFFTEIKAQSAGFDFIIVHGGGADVTAVSRKLGIEAEFKDGIRRTSEVEMDIVDMVLSGRINTRLVRLCRAAGLNAAGVSCSDGGLFIGRPVSDSTSNRTGEIDVVNPKLLEILLSGGFLPVVSPACMDEEGGGLNINADQAAFALAAAVKAEALVFFSDVPGILRDGSLVPELSIEEARLLIQEGVISGGMIPKMTSSLEAIRLGVKKVIIGEYSKSGDLEDFLKGNAGTRIHG